MRVPVSWLREYVDWNGTVEELADLLSLSGTEVEAIHWAGAPNDADNLARFVVGKVTSCEKHPNADKLSLCQVEVGEASGGSRQIVCGAPNVAAGQTVAVSLAGAVLENGLKLRKANLRGVESDGMILSEAELGFENDSPGILELPGDLPVGDPLTRHLPVSEAVLEVEITPNRPDCTSIYGIAREVAAAAALPLKPPPLDEPPTAGAPASDAIAVEIAAPDLCARYGAKVVRGVTVGDSPVWMKARLTHAGMRPINNVVDVTNYAMLAVGEPLHAFDAAKIKGDRLIARRSRAGETIVTLDGIERTLQTDNLVIADVERALVIAGIFGAVDAEVDEATTDLVLEAATFDGPNIMRTSKEVGWRSEASSRFEKGLDASAVPQGLALAARLLVELCGGSLAPGTVDVSGDEPPKPPRLTYRPAKCDALLGLAIEPREQAAILGRLECAVEGGGGELFVTPPPFRRDLEREVDLIEEVGRIHGLGQVPETFPLRRDAVGALNKGQRVRRVARDAMVGAGLDEVATYSFIGPDALDPLLLAAGDGRATPIALANPMSGEQSVMRTLQLPGLLGAVRENLAHQNFPLALFEQGRVYRRGDGVSLDSPGPLVAGHAERYARPWPLVETESLGIVVCGPLGGDAWTGEARATDFYTVKGVVERLLAALRIADATFERSAEPFLHPGMSADLLAGGQPVGWLGVVRPDVAAGFAIDDHVVVAAELSLDALRDAALTTTLFDDLTTFPPAAQDVALVLDRDTPADDVVALVRRAGGKLVRQAWVFDAYEGEQVPDGKRSLAVRIVMRSPERTLTDKDIAGVRQKVLKALEREFGAALR